MKALVSVIIPLYNGEKYIEETIKSVLSQTYAPVEIIVVDDGSTDKGADIARQYPVILIQQKNKGISGARNTGINASKGEFIALLDQDDLFKPNKIELQVNFLNKHPEYDMVYTPEERFGQGEPIRRISSHHVGKTISGNLFTDLYKQNYITPSSTLIRRSVLEITGFFDENFAVCEEHELFIRIACHGSIGFINEPLVEYRWHGGNTSSKLSQLYPFNEFKILKRYLFMLKKKTMLWPFIYLYHSARVQMNMGIVCINEKKYVEAASHLLSSFLKRPFRVKTIRNLIKAILGIIRGLIR